MSNRYKPTRRNEFRGTLEHMAQNTDRDEMSDLLADFFSQHPGISIEDFRHFYHNWRPVTEVPCDSAT